MLPGVLSGRGRTRSWRRPSGTLYSLKLHSEAGLTAGWIEFCHTLMGMDDRVSARIVSYAHCCWGQRSGRWGHLSPEAKMFSNLRLCKTPRSPPDGRQPVSLFKRKITRAGCQGGGIGSPPSTAGKLISLILKHLQLKTRQLRRDWLMLRLKAPLLCSMGFRKAEPKTLSIGLA